MKRGRFVAAIIPALAAWAVALVLTAGTAMAATSHPAAVRHTAVRHTAVRHTAVQHTAVQHTAVQHTAVQHTAVQHAAVGAASYARAAVPPVVIDCSADQVRPRTFILNCADGNNYLTGLSWSAWSAAFASGTGTQMINDCWPTCAGGKVHSYPVDVVFWLSAAIPQHPGKRYFSRVTVLYPGARPSAYWHAKPQTGPETWTGTLAG